MQEFRVIFVLHMFNEGILFISALEETDIQATAIMICNKSRMVVLIGGYGITFMLIIRCSGNVN